MSEFLTKIVTIHVGLEPEAKAMIESKKDLADIVSKHADAARSAQPKSTDGSIDSKKFELSTDAKGHLIVKDCDPARILKALYNASKPVGMGFYALNKTTAQPMTTEDARTYISEYNGQCYWDYVHGRPVKSSIYKDTIDPRGFDRDNGGAGTCKRVLEVEFS